MYGLRAVVKNANFTGDVATHKRNVPTKNSTIYQTYYVRLRFLCSIASKFTLSSKPN